MTLDIRKVFAHYGFSPERTSGNVEFYRCPLHDEKTPSLAVYPDGGWYCFGCNQGGRAARFVQLYRGVSREMALIELEKIFGIELTKRDQQYAELYQAVNRVAEMYHQEIFKHPDLIRYLNNRGLDQSDIKDWKIGYALDRHVMQDDKLYPVLHRAGILSCDDLYRPIFVNRITFPIYNLYGSVIGFTARSNPFLPQMGGKYINSPNNELFNKKNAVFGLREPLYRMIKERGFLALVEGAMDAVICQKYGVPAVALLGLGSNNLDILDTLKSFAKTFVLLLDGDKAGRQRVLGLAQRGVFPFLADNPHCRIQVVNLPEGKDPDEVILEDGGSTLFRLVESAASLEQYVAELIREECQAIADVGNRRAHLYSHYADLLRSMPQPVKKHYLQWLHEHLNLDLSDLIKTPPRKPSPVRQVAPDRQQPPQKVPEKDSVAPTKQPDQAGWDGAITPSYLSNYPRLARLRMCPDRLERFNALLSDHNLPPLTPYVPQSCSLNFDSQTDLSRDLPDLLQEYHRLIFQKLGAERGLEWDAGMIADFFRNYEALRMDIFSSPGITGTHKKS